MLTINCPHCERTIDVSTVVPEPGGPNSIALCGNCGEAFSYAPHDITELVFDQKAEQAKAAAA